MKHPKSPSLPYRPCVGLMMINSKGQVFMGERLSSIPGQWQMPQGGIDPNESLEQAALRELYEETGAQSVRILKVSEKWHAYDVPPFLRPKFWKGMYRGQTQKWCLIGFEGEDAEINLTLMPEGGNPLTTHQEFSQWKWVAAQEVIQLAVDFKRPIYQAVVEEFLPFIKKYQKQVVGRETL